MKLSTENAGSVVSPTDQDVVDLLTDLDGFAILEVDELTYLQAAGTPQEGYALEYQEGDLSRHFAVDGTSAIEQVIAAFQAFARGDNSWRQRFSWQRQDISADRRGCLPAAAALWMVVGPIMAALCCLTIAGCKDKTVRAVIVYQATPQAGSAASQVPVSAVVESLGRRLNGRGQARLVDRSHIEVGLYDELTASELAALIPLTGAQGNLEFRIMASPTAKTHAPAIELAETLPDDKTAVEIEGKPTARWVECDQREFGGEEEARTRGLVVRTVGKKLQALAMVDDGLNVDGTFMRSAVVDADEAGRPRVSFTFDSQGASRFGQLTGSHLPTPSGEKFMLGILLDDRLLSAPTIMSKITDRGLISGGSMTSLQVHALVALFHDGALPYPIRPISSEIIKKK